MEWTMETHYRNTNDYVEIKDISIAAYLYASNQVKLVGKRKLPNGSILLQFSPKEKADELITQYWNFQAPEIQPKRLLSALRDVKDLIFGG